MYGLKITNCLVRDGLNWGEQPLINNEGWVWTLTLTHYCNMQTQWLHCLEKFTSIFHVESSDWNTAKKKKFFNEMGREIGHFRMWLEGEGQILKAENRFDFILKKWYYPITKWFEIWKGNGTFDQGSANLLRYFAEFNALPSLVSLLIYFL